jgi:PhnB protein
MPRLSQSEQFDRIAQDVLARGRTARGKDGAGLDPQMAALLPIAEELRTIPREDFKSALKAKLEGRTTTMASTAPAANQEQTPRQSVTAHLIVKGGARALDFYKQAFGAVVTMRLNGPAERVAHAELRIGNATFMLADEFPEHGSVSPQTLGGSPVTLHIAVDDADAAFARAVEAGARVSRPVQDQFYGERSGQVIDPFGFIWSLSAPKEIVSSEEMQNRFDKIVKGEPRPKDQTWELPVPYIRKGFRTLTPYLTVPNAEELIEFVKETFGAAELSRSTGTAAGIHCELRVGNSVIMVGGGTAEKPWSGAVTPAALHVYVSDCDAVYRRAIAARGTSTFEPTDQPYGERTAGVVDRSGNFWNIAFPSYLGQNPYDPDSVQTVQTYLVSSNGAAQIEFLKDAFAGKELGRATSPAGTVQHSTIKIGDSTLEVVEAHGPFQPRPATSYLYVNDADDSYERALRAGGTSINQPENKDYGDRVGAVRDVFGNQWYIATQIAEPAKVSAANSPVQSAPSVPYIRKGFHTVTPYLLVSGAAKLINFFKEGFGAEEIFRMPPAGQSIMHAELRVGDSMLELSDATAEFPPRTVMHILQVDNVDASYRRALQAGGTSLSEPVERPYGDREAGIADLAGNHWYLTERRATGHVTADTRTITPGFTSVNAAGFVEFMKQAFHAEEAFMHKSPAGTVIHGRIRIGDSILAVGEARGDFPAMPFHLHLYVPDTDSVYASALRAGAKSIRAPKDEPYGDRAAVVQDTYGNLWSIATHVKDVKF